LRKPNGLGFEGGRQAADQSVGELLNEYCPEMAGTLAKLTIGGTISLLNSERSNRSKIFTLILSLAKLFDLEEQMRVLSGTFPDRCKTNSHEIREPSGEAINLEIDEAFGEVIGKAPGKAVEEAIDLEIHERLAR
jgi:hypothetical protein